MGLFYGHVFWWGGLMFFTLLMVEVGPTWGQRNSSGFGVSSMARPKSVNIGAFFTFNSVIGRALKPAITAAVDDINSNSSILHGTTINLIFYDTKCSGFVGTMGGNSCDFRTLLVFPFFINFTICWVEDLIINNQSLGVFLGSI